MASFQVHWNVSAGETERKNVIRGLLWLFLVDSQCSTAWWTLLHCWAPSNMKCSLQLRSPLLILLHRLTAWILHWFFMYWTPTLQKNMEQHHRNLAEIKKKTFLRPPSCLSSPEKAGWQTLFIDVLKFTQQLAMFISNFDGVWEYWVNYFLAYSS